MESMRLWESQVIYYEGHWETYPLSDELTIKLLSEMTDALAKQRIGAV